MPSPKYTGSLPPTLLTLDDLRAAAARIGTHVRRTPLLDIPARLGPGQPERTLWLKCENLQPMGAFKLRGATNMLARLTERERAAGVVTYSSGNHGLAVAVAARALSLHAVVTVPETIPQVKLDGIRRAGAEVIYAGVTLPDRRIRAEQEVATRGLTMVPPFDHPWIIEGQGTVGLEILEQLPGVATIYVPVGGGGLASGVATAAKRTNPAIRVIGVEPAGAPKLSTSLAAGHPVTLDQSASIADGLLSLRPGDLTFAHLREFLDAVVTVEEDEIAAAVRWLFSEARLVAEPSGAVSVAAALAGAGQSDSGDNAPVVAVLSGGNVDPERYIDCLRPISPEPGS